MSIIDLDDIESDIESYSDNELPISSILNSIKTTNSVKCETIDLDDIKSDIESYSDNELPISSILNSNKTTNSVKCQIIDLDDIESDIESYSDNELPVSSILNSIKTTNSVKCEIIDLDDIKSDIESYSDNELPISSILNSNKTTNSVKCQTIDLDDIKSDIESYSDNELPVSSILNSNKTTNSVNCQTIDLDDIKSDIESYSDNELPLSSISNVLLPINNHEFINNSDIQKNESTDYPSTLNIIQDYKSERSLIHNQKQNVDNLANKYECEICGKIFSKRILIIKHFRNSLCFPESNVYFKNNNSKHNLCNHSKNSILYMNDTNNLRINDTKQIKKCKIYRSVIQNNKYEKNRNISYTKENNSKYKSCSEYCSIPCTTTHYKKKGSRWKCKICGEIFPKLSILKSHIFIHSENKSLNCCKCIKSCIHFNSIDKLKTIHNTLSCSICHKQFSDNSSLMAHQLIHNLKNINNYNTCQENNFNSSLFQPISKLHNFSKSYECSMCSKIFHKYSEILNHIFKFHEEHYSKYSCDTCSNLYKSSKDEYVLHLEKTLFKCDVCSHSFTTAYRLHQHYRWHLGINKFKCQYCSKIFSKFSAYLFHEKKHTKEKPFRCNFCGKWFSVLSNLNIHLKFNGTFVCGICQKKFSQMSSLLFHKKNHSKDKRLENKNDVLRKSSSLKIDAKKNTDKKIFKCNSCFKSYTRLYLLNSHILNTHNTKNYQKSDDSIISKSLNNDGCFKCKICQEIFSERNNLTTHKCFSYECRFCQNKFSNISLLIKHHKNVHKNIPNPHDTNINKHMNIQPENNFSLALNVDNELNKMENIFLNKYKCDICTVEIYNPSQVINHILQTHY